jgi:hypothetical protein
MAVNGGTKPVSIKDDEYLVPGSRFQVQGSTFKVQGSRFNLEL